MSKTTFKVDPRLAALLGENYRSSELALRELVDNAWDAEAQNVWITLPSVLTDDAIIEFRDDGSGMTPEELRKDYLIIANNRRDRRGDITRSGRAVKGRKGIGKFAGLFVGGTMQLDTRARSVHTTVLIEKHTLAAASRDIEEIELPIFEEGCDPNEHGTTIRIRSINQNLTYPNPDRLRAILIMEYGRQDNFSIFVNGERLDVADVRGEVFTHAEVLTEVGPVLLRFVVSQSNERLRQPGVAVRVKGKIVGRPEFFGLEAQSPDIPSKLLKKVYGEITVDSDQLLDFVTADWGALIENSIPVQTLADFVCQKLDAALRLVFSNQINLAKARLQKEVDARLRKLPQHKREYASRALDRLVKNYYDLPENKLAALIRVFLDTIEKDEYWEVIRRIDEAQHADVATFAAALNQFGLVELSFVAQQARFRLQFLDRLQQLIDNPATLEKDIHQALEKALWVFGPEYSVFSSNETLVSNIRKLTGQSDYQGADAKHRPDLLLSRDRGGRYLLIEFKRPAHAITQFDVAQAANYRDTLATFFTAVNMEIFVIGGRSNISPQYPLAQGIKVLTFLDVLSSARDALQWLLEELAQPPRPQSAAAFQL
jgi:hypothetical protein